MLNGGETTGALSPDAEDRLAAVKSASERAGAFWNSLPKDGAETHPFLVEHEIKPHGTRIGKGDEFDTSVKGVDCLIMAVRPAHKSPGKPTLQAIAPDGEVYHYPGVPTDGAYSMIGGDKDNCPIAFCIDFASAVSIHEATGWLVVVCLYGSNMKRVAAWAKTRWAGREMVVAGSDISNIDPDRIDRDREAAIDMARILGARIALPELHGVVGSTFNDQARFVDLDSVRDTLEHAGGPSDIDPPADVPTDDPQFQADHAENHEVGKLGFRIKDWSTSRFLGPAPPVEWLVQGIIPRGVPGMIASLGGLGKSYKAIELGLEIAIAVAGKPSGRKVLGGPVVHHGSVVILNAEDSQASIHRRLERLDPDGRKRKLGDGKIYIVPLPAAGGPKPLVNGGQPPACTEYFYALMEELDQIDDLALVIADPLQAFIAADVTSDPAAAQFMWTAFAALCARKNATFIFTHHMRKDGSAKITSAEDAREAIRGVTTLVDGSRFSYCIWTANEEDGRLLCSQAGIDYAPRKVAYGAVVKANDEHDTTIHTYIRGQSGLLEDASEVARKSREAKDGLTPLQVGGALTEVHRRWLEKNPFSKGWNSPGRNLGKWLEMQYALPRKLARDTVEAWLMNEILVEGVCDKHTKLRGLLVEKWPADATAALAEVRKNGGAKNG